MYVCVLIKMTTVVEGDPKTPFLIATTPGCREGWYSILLLHFNLDAWLIMLSVRQGGMRYFFLSIWYDSIVPRSLEPLVNIFIIKGFQTIVFIFILTKNEDNSPKTLNDKSHLASSQKF